MSYMGVKIIIYGYFIIFFSDDITRCFEMGLAKFSSPLRNDLINLGDRILSFKNWPERVHQKPVELARAGFYYFGMF